MEIILEKIERYILYAVVFLVPIAVLPVSPSPFIVTKLSILAYGVGLALLVRAIRVIATGKLNFSTGSFDFPVLLIALAYLISAIVRAPNKMEALLLPGTATGLIGAAILYFLLNQLRDKEKDIVKMFLLLSGGIYGLIMLLARVGVFAKIPQLPNFMEQTTFTPEGGYLPAAIFLAILIPLASGLVIAEKKIQKKAVLGVSLALVLVGLGFAIFNIFPGKPLSPRLPDVNTSWFIAIDALKESPIFGIGPGNYLTAFNRFRPITHNASDLWALKFATANDYYLTALTETGLIGAAGIILLFLAGYRLLKKEFKEKRLTSWGASGSSNLAALALALVLLAVFPATVAVLVLFFVLLAINSKVKRTSINLSSQVTSSEGQPGTKGIASRLPALLVTLPVIIAVLYGGFRGLRLLRAEFSFRQSLTALARNEGIKSYDLMREAINLNPLVDRYHASYSQINLALANAIAAQASGPEGEITDQDRANIAQLIQQAIREGKATVALNPLRAGNWEVLAIIYRAIIPFAQGADAFAIQSYRQAVILDPINPNLRVALGGVHFAQGNFDTAIRVFELATVAKPDLANAHYNLAFALREDGEIERAIQEMTIVLSLVDRGTADYETARTALEDLEARRAEITAQAGEELFPPLPAGEPALVPPLELPEESEPPEAPLTPTPTEEPTPTPTISPTPTPAP